MTRRTYVYVAVLLGIVLCPQWQSWSPIACADTCTSSTLSFVAPALAQERITLSVAETAPNNQTYRVERMLLEHDDPDTAADEGRITIQLLGVERRIPVTCTYNATTNPTGTATLIALNKANLSSAYAANSTTGSLVQRIFHRLVVMGEATAVCGRSLTGSLTGSPQ